MGYCTGYLSSVRDQDYHDKEWGIPVYDDYKQFEYLMMEVMQCGLSWTLMLRKREIFYNCFHHFDYDKIALYNQSDINRIMQTENMIRSERKIRAVIQNAQCFQEIRCLYGSFSHYLWRYSEGKTILYDGRQTGRIPTSNGLSEKISCDLKKRGFRYLGPITVYAHLQACGMINDHEKTCPCYQKIIDHFPVVHKKRDQEKF